VRNPDITIEETCPYHLRDMAIAMQPEITDIAIRAGITPLKALWSNYRKSIICKSVFIDGRLCAIFGLSGAIFCDTGMPWICMTPETQEHPFRVAFRFRQELKKMLDLFPVLEDYIEETNEKGIRFLELMNFHVSKNRIPIGNIVFRRAERRL